MEEDEIRTVQIMHIFYSLTKTHITWLASNAYLLNPQIHMSKQRLRYMLKLFVHDHIIGFKQGLSLSPLLSASAIVHAHSFVYHFYVLGAACD